jgi:hypothetical protein
MKFIEWKQEEDRKAKALISAGYDGSMDGEAYHTVSGQNGNNSVSVSHDFMSAIRNNSEWETWWRVDKRKFVDARGHCDTEKLRASCRPASVIVARDLWKKIAHAAWECADPGLHFNGTMNDWNTLADVGLIKSSNPCLTADMRVAVVGRDKKLYWIKIGEIKDKDVDVVTYDFEKQKIDVARAKNLGMTRSNSDVISVKTKSGELKLTPDHEVMTQRGWVKAGNLKPGDKIARTVNKNPCD